VLGRRLLPTSQKSSATSQSLQHFRDVYGIDGRIFEVEVQAESRLIGRTLGDLTSHGRAGWILGVKSGKDLQRLAKVPFWPLWVQNVPLKIMLCHVS